MTLIFLLFSALVLITVCCHEWLHRAVVFVDFHGRVDRAQYALACDDEACAHYEESPNRWLRANAAIKAFVLNT